MRKHKTHTLKYNLEACHLVIYLSVSLYTTMSAYRFGFEQNNLDPDPDLQH
jgi:hypothetical protein